ncbi:MAG: glycosyltransferase family 1 protein [Patescibacteria group bacterium]|nr:glycosyltransferase family 1 protein [Patescibacteria group bacterium]
MRIGIDARSILNPEKNPAIGVGHYTFQLIRHLLKLDQRNQYEIFFDYRVRQKDIKKFSKPNVKIKYFPWSDYKKYLPGAYSEILGLATLTGKDFDVLHITSPDARVPLGYRGKVVCTFQDLAVFKFPKYFSQGRRFKAQYNRKAMATRADKLIAVSDNTKNDLIDLFNVPEEKISVIHNAADKRFLQEMKIDKDQLKDDLCDRFRIERDYVLFVGTLEPIKNITRLIQAFKLFKDSNKKTGNPRNYQLVLAGKKGWLAKEYFQIAKDFGLEKDIKFLGYVEGEDLKKLMKGAKLFVMPSLYEGFGMTVLEALSCKTPSIISDIDPLRKIAGKSVVYIDSHDIEDIAKKIGSLIEDHERKSQLARDGFLRAKNFSWEKCARETLEIYSAIAQKNNKIVDFDSRKHTL